ncbi:MAG: YHS domain-containing (seleno)protein [Gammaproteobacteria bacterium]
MKVKNVFLAIIASMGFATAASADSAIATSTTAVQGYDLVSYHTSKRPLRGNGHFLSVRDGVTYLFSSEENKKKFDRNVEKYLPAYGGYCAFGVSVGKKFVGDPEVYRVVNGKLYLNLDTTIQDLWLKDVPGRIETADSNWKQIKDKSPAEL